MTDLVASRFFFELTELIKDGKMLTEVRFVTNGMKRRKVTFGVQGSDTTFFVTVNTYIQKGETRRKVNAGGRNIPTLGHFGRQLVYPYPSSGTEVAAANALAEAVYAMKLLKGKEEIGVNEIKHSFAILRGSNRDQQITETEAGAA